MLKSAAQCRAFRAGEAARKEQGRQQEQMHDESAAHCERCMSRWRWCTATLVRQRATPSVSWRWTPLRSLTWRLRWRSAMSVPPLSPPCRQAACCVLECCVCCAACAVCCVQGALCCKPQLGDRADRGAQWPPADACVPARGRRMDSDCTVLFLDWYASGCCWCLTDTRVAV